MTKIYLIKNQMILEIELIKETPEQLRIDNRNIEVVWSDDPKKYKPYFSTRLIRHREVYFSSIPAAVDYLSEKTRQSIENLVKSINNCQVRLAALVAFADKLKEEEESHAD